MEQRLEKQTEEMTRAAREMTEAARELWLDVDQPTAARAGHGRDRQGLGGSP